MMILAYVSATCRCFAGKDHISHQWEKEIIDSNVPTGREYVEFPGG